MKEEELAIYILKSPIRKKIIELVKEKSMTITELHKAIKKSNGSLYDYRGVYREVNNLKELGVVETQYQRKKKNHPVIVSYKRKFNIKMDKGITQLGFGFLNPKNWKYDYLFF